ncbi:toprim domain-containing protein [Neiella marina]|uniref:Toprim domain-containing protein n=1 Tax=Neiella holothuriorum TaxID=2870530 RepID=A0ABS7EKQ9_9GAMM|nr:toprim domain-containing protein [Neiella holothuriorum]MBW8192951.1 toprim domain-containing protein [Neiella holothuriorum]
MYRPEHSKISKVKALVESSGGWRKVFSNYPGLSHAIEKADKSNASNPPQVPCPRSLQGKTKFRLFKDWEYTGGGYHNDEGAMPDGIEVMTFMEGSKNGALDVIIDILGGDLRSVTKHQIQHVQQQQQSVREQQLDPQEVAQRQTKVEKVFSRASFARDSQAVHNYLRSRGLQGDFRLLPDALGFADPLWYGDDTTTQPLKLAGMLGIMSDSDNRNVTLHRTFLNPTTGAKAKVKQPKQLMQSPSYIGGCSIKLDQPIAAGDGALIGLCEGIETALACREATGLPMWSCYSNTLLEMVELYDGITNVVIFADKDVSGAGQRSAATLARRLRTAGIDVQVHVPELDIPEGAKSVDWLDVYVQEGALAFPFGIPPQFAVNTGVTLPEEA